MKITIEQIREVLADIPDPEMPISIVDLGLVHDVRITTNEPDAQPAAETAPDTPPPARIEVDILPTFVGCPALDMIRDEIRTRLAAAAGGADIRVNFLHDPPWSVDRISNAGRERLRQFGVTVPTRPAQTPLVPLTVSTAQPAPQTPAALIACPFCGADATEQVSRFGPTRCKMIYYCTACRNSFEHLKSV